MKVFLFAISNSGHMFPSCSIGFQDGWHVLSNDIGKIKKKKNQTVDLCPNDARCRLTNEPIS